MYYCFVAYDIFPYCFLLYFPANFYHFLDQMVIKIIVLCMESSFFHGELFFLPKNFVFSILMWFSLSFLLSFVKFFTCIIYFGENLGHFSISFLPILFFSSDFTLQLHVYWLLILPCIVREIVFIYSFILFFYSFICF